MTNTNPAIPAANTTAQPRIAAFPVAVLTRKGESSNAWVDECWSVEAVLVGKGVAADPEPSPIRPDQPDNGLLWGGFELRLHPSDGESYYVNLLADQPKVFVVCTAQAPAGLRPILVTLSYDEAMSHMEGDDDVYSVPMPAEIVRWLEDYVLEYYVPTKKKKRKRVDWKDPESRHEGY